MAQMNDEQMKQLQEKIKNMSPEELAAFQKQQCIFCQIISGKVQSRKVYEDDKAIAILDINPANPGHLILLPKEHYAIMPHIPDDILRHMSMVAKHLSQALLKALSVKGTTIFIANGVAAGQKAQHFLMHIIPRTENDKLPLNLPEKKASSSELAKVKSSLMPQIAKAFGLPAEQVEVRKPKQPAMAEIIQEPKPKKAKQSKKSEPVDLDQITNLFGGS